MAFKRQMYYCCHMNDLVVKHNALTNASYSLSLTEQRLILLAIVGARSSGHGINSNEPLVVSASDYGQQFSVHRNTAYQAMHDACEHLFDRRFRYQLVNEKGNVENIITRWVSEVRYVENEAVVKLIFSPAVVPLITQLERHFTQYAIEQIAGLNSAYAVRLYEILISWRGAQRIEMIKLDDLRKRLGLADDDYTRMSDFKRRVLDLAIDQVNKHTDITAKYKQHKNGRKIVGFSFNFTFKKGIEAKTKRRSYTKTDLEKQPDLAHPGETYEQALKRMNTRGGLLGTQEEQTEITKL